MQAAAEVQITAEQLLREAYERQDVAPPRPKHAILDLEELQEYQGRQRKDFENKIRRNRLRMGEYLRYANWELEQKEYARYVVPLYNVLEECC
jgi:crooked neck